VEEEVHRAKSRGVVDDLASRECLIAEEALLIAVEVVVGGDVVVRGQKEATGAAAGVGDPLARPRLHHVDHRLDQRSGGEVLAGAGLGVGGVLLEQPFVGVALDVGVDSGPGLGLDQVDDQPAQLGRILDAILGLAEDQAERA